MAVASKGKRLTPTERAIVLLVTSLGGDPCPKSRMAELLERDVKTIDRLVSNLRRRGVLTSTPTYGPDGGQLANVYRVADLDVLAECVRLAAR